MASDGENPPAESRPRCLNQPPLAPEVMNLHRKQPMQCHMVPPGYSSHGAVPGSVRLEHGGLIPSSSLGINDPGIYRMQEDSLYANRAPLVSNIAHGGYSPPMTSSKLRPDNIYYPPNYVMKPHRETLLKQESRSSCDVGDYFTHRSSFADHGTCRNIPKRDFGSFRGVVGDYRTGPYLPAHHYQGVGEGMGPSFPPPAHSRVHPSPNPLPWDPASQCSSQNDYHNQQYGYPGYPQPSGHHGPPYSLPPTQPPPPHPAHSFSNHHTMLHPAESTPLPSPIPGDRTSHAQPTLQDLEAERATRRARRNRTCFTRHQLECLETVFSAQRYPDIYRREDMSAQMGLKEEVIRVWFKNRRAKAKRQVKDSHPRVGSTTTPTVHTQSTPSPVLVAPSGESHAHQAELYAGEYYPTSPESITSCDVSADITGSTDVSVEGVDVDYVDSMTSPITGSDVGAVNAHGQQLEAPKENNNNIVECVFAAHEIQAEVLGGSDMRKL